MSIPQPSVGIANDGRASCSNTTKFITRVRPGWRVMFSKIDILRIAQSRPGSEWMPVRYIATRNAFVRLCDAAGERIDAKAWVFLLALPGMIAG